MKKISIFLLVAAYFSCKTMETPQKPSSSLLTIVGQQIGIIDTFCQTTAKLYQEGISLAEISYTLRGRDVICSNCTYAGPRAYIQNRFLAHIKKITFTDKVNTDETKKYAITNVLLALAISQLRESHKKQNKEGVEHQDLYIDRVIESKSSEKSILNDFGFQQVENWAIGTPNGIVFETLYLLNNDPASIEKTSIKCKNYLHSVISVAIEEKLNEKVPNTFCEENQWTKLLDEVDKPQKASILQEALPVPAAADPVIAAFPRSIRTVPESKTRKAPETSSSDDDFLPTSAYALSQHELRKAGLAKLAANRGKKVRLPRAELLAIQYKGDLKPSNSHPGLTTIGVSKKKKTNTTA